MADVVLDASALLALLNDEAGAAEVAATFPGALIGCVNLSEVVAKLNEKGMPEAEIRSALHGLGLEVASFDEELAYATGALRSSTRTLGLSLGDRACLALGVRTGLPVLTTESGWSDAAPVEVRVIR